MNRPRSKNIKYQHIMRIMTALVILPLITFGQVFAQTKKSDFKQIFPLGEKNDANAQYFIGQSYLAVLTKDNVTSYNVTFEPGCRNNWHIHHKGGQILYCTAGKGWYQEEGKPARALRPGDVVNIPAGVKHWHGAAKDSWFAHIALMVPAEGATHEWLNPVTDEEYNKLK